MIALTDALQPTLIVRHPAEATGEGFIDGLQRRGDCVLVDLTFDSGAVATLVLEADEADWLELEPGAIVYVRRPASAGANGAGAGVSTGLRRDRAA